MKLQTVLVYLLLSFAVCSGYIINPLSEQQPIDQLVKPKDQIDLSSIGREGYAINYSLDDEQKKIKLLFTSPLLEKEWLGIGFNYLMHTNHMVIIQYIGKYIDIFEAYSENYSFPSTKTSSSSLNFLAYYQDQHSKYIFIETDFHKNDKDYISIAYGPTETMQFHGRRKGRFIIPLQDGVAINKNDEVIVVNIIYKLHTTWLYYGWGYLADIAILSVRYLKGWQYYITLHSAFFFILNLFTIIIESLLLIYNQPRIQNISYLDIYLHFILSSIFLAAVLFQHLSGYILKKQIYDKQIQLIIPKIKKIHQILGYILYFLGKFIIFTGKWSSSILKNVDKGYYGAIKDCSLDFTMILVGWFIVEGLYRKGKIQMLCYKVLTCLMDTVQLSKKEINSQEKLKLMSLINKQTTIHEISIEFTNINYCIIGQKVYDLSGFLHPGGNYMLRLINGREVQRYLNGQQHMEGIQHSIDTVNKPYTHPISSILFLKQKYIGTIDYTNRSILKYSPYTDRKANNNNNNNNNNNDNNKEESINRNDESIDDASYGDRTSVLSLPSLQTGECGTPLIHDTYTFQIAKQDRFLFYFKNHSCQIRNTMTGIEWLGLHFCIYKKQDKNSKNRLYTTVVCMTGYNQRKRKEISDMLNTSRLNMNFIHQSFANKLPFIIKKYNINGAFSKHLHENIEQVYKIEGPLGRGLEMSNAFKGDIAIIANGTGILPFLDLLYYYLQRNAYLYAKKIGKQSQFLKIFDQTEEDFSYLENSGIYLFVSFENLEYFYGYEIIQDILKSEQLLGINNFHLTLRLRDATDYKQFQGKFVQQDSYFDKEFIDRISSNVLSKVKRIYVSGSQDLTYAISEALRCTSHLNQKLFYI